MSDNNLDTGFLEKIIVKGMLEDKQFLILVAQTFQKEYFDDSAIGEIFEISKDYLTKYNDVPPKDIIANSSKDKKSITSTLKDISQIDFNVSKHYKVLLDNTNKYLKEQAVKRAIIDSVDIIDKGYDKALIRKKVEDALCKDISIDLGLRYFEDLGDRLKRIFNATDVKVPTYFRTLDEMISGGFPPLTLSIFASKVHGFKCVGENTNIVIREKETGNIKSTRIKDFYNSFHKENRHHRDDTQIGDDIVYNKYIVNNYEVLTDIGWVDISYVIKTVKFKKYCVFFNSGEYIECADNHTFIDIEYNNVFAKNLKEGDLILSKNGIDEIFDIIETDEYTHMYDISLPYHNLYYTNSILSHNSNTVINFAVRQVLNNKNVVLMSMEMSQDSIAQRIDSILSYMDINRMYLGGNKKKLVNKLKDVRENRKGEIFIKEFPTGEASVNELTAYLRELKIRGVELDILYVDYINLMRSAYKTDGSLYSSVKKVGEELRALSFEFKVPIISLTQLNREGTFVGFEDVDFNYLAESYGTAATADAVFIYGINEDDMVYSSTIQCKVVKNRLGGRVGEHFSMYYDQKTLKMYDETEMDQWMADARITGDEREPYVRRERPENNRRR